MTLSALRVDMNGAGTITAFTPAENGILYLENVEGGRISGEVTLPLTVSSVDSSTAFKSWKVFVDGYQTDLKVRWNGTRMLVGPKLGMTIVFR